MASRSRIRWENVAKLGAGGAACVALAAALPGLLRRPEPPPLESDVGFASAVDAPPPPADRHRRPRHRERGREGRHPVRRRFTPRAPAPYTRAGPRHMSRRCPQSPGASAHAGARTHCHPDRRGGSRAGDLFGAGRPAEASRSPATADSPAARSAGARAPPIRVRVRALSGEGQAVRSPSAGWIGRRAVAAITRARGSRTRVAGRRAGRDLPGGALQPRSGRIPRRCDLRAQLAALPVRCFVQGGRKRAPGAPAPGRLRRRRLGCLGDSRPQGHGHLGAQREGGRPLGARPGPRAAPRPGGSADPLRQSDARAAAIQMGWCGCSEPWRPAPLRASLRLPARSRRRDTGQAGGARPRGSRGSDAEPRWLAVRARKPARPADRRSVGRRRRRAASGGSCSRSTACPSRPTPSAVAWSRGSRSAFSPARAARATRLAAATASPPFRQGPNLVRVCAADYAVTTAANRSCARRRVRVDNLCPVSEIGGATTLRARLRQRGRRSVGRRPRPRRSGAGRPGRARLPGHARAAARERPSEWWPPPWPASAGDSECSFPRARAARCESPAGRARLRPSSAISGSMSRFGPVCAFARATRSPTAAGCASRSGCRDRRTGDAG